MDGGAALSREGADDLACQAFVLAACRGLGGFRV